MHINLGQNLSQSERLPVELKIASCHSSLGEHERAIEEYELIKELSPGSIQAAEAAYQIGLIWERHFGDYEKAVASYSEVDGMGVQATRSVYGEQAMSRRNELARLIERAVEGAKHPRSRLFRQILYDDAGSIRRHPAHRRRRRRCEAAEAIAES